MLLTKTLVILAPPSALAHVPRHQLARSGFFVAGVGSSGQAIKVAETFAAQEILVDERMLDGGSEVLEELRASPWTKDVSVHICRDCTSLGQLGAVLDDLHSGVVGIVPH
jgi:hypothetical protein